MSVGLKVHLKRHKSTGDLTCPEYGCQQTFVTQSSLDIHFKKHFSSDDVSSFICPDQSCSQRFVSKANLDNHLYQHRNTGSMQSAEKHPGAEHYINKLNSNNGELENAGHSSLETPLALGLASSMEVLQSTVEGRSMSPPSNKIGAGGFVRNVNDISTFQPSFTEGHFRYTSASDLKGTETASMSNSSDVVNLFNQSYFTIDDSEAALKLLSFLATRGNLHILDNESKAFSDSVVNEGKVTHVENVRTSQNEMLINNRTTAYSISTITKPLMSNRDINNVDTEFGSVVTHIKSRLHEGHPIADSPYKNETSVIKCSKSTHACSATKVEQNLIESFASKTEHFSNNDRSDSLNKENANIGNGLPKENKSVGVNVSSITCACCKCLICVCKPKEKEQKFININTSSLNKDSN